jgi:hypothetical protein
MARYLIPKPISQRYELFPGRGFPGGRHGSRACAGGRPSFRAP